MAKLMVIQSYLDDSLREHWVPWCESFLSKRLLLNNQTLDKFELKMIDGLHVEGSNIPSRAKEFFRLGLLKYSISLTGNKTKAWKVLYNNHSIINHFGYIVYYLLKAQERKEGNLNLERAISAMSAVAVLKQSVKFDSRSVLMNTLMFKAIDSFPSTKNKYLHRQYLCAAISSSIKEGKYCNSILDALQTSKTIPELIISTIKPTIIRDIVNPSSIDNYLEETNNGNLSFDNIINQRFSNFYIGNYKGNSKRGAFNNATEHFEDFLFECYEIDSKNFASNPFVTLLENSENNIDPILALQKIFNVYGGDLKLLNEVMKTLYEGVQEALSILGISGIEYTNDSKSVNLVTKKYKSIGENKIYFGAPGTGKSYAINEKLKFDGIDTTHYKRITFHPDMDYSSFIGGYKPYTDEKDDGKIKYKFVPQVFVDMYVKAWSAPSENFCLVIEEINRGNCAEIFGDVFQLLDRNSEYNIEPSTELREYLQNVEDENIKLLFEGKLQMPQNLSILASMNTSDQSLYPMDSAFKRRWDWEYISINTDCKDSNFSIEISEMHKYFWLDFLKAVNQKIYEITKSEDKQVGNWFVNALKTDNIINKETFINKVVFYLWNDVFKDEVFHPENIFVLLDSENKKIKSISFNDFFNKAEQHTLLVNLIESVLGVENQVKSKSSVDTESE